MASAASNDAYTNPWGSGAQAPNQTWGNQGWSNQGWQNQGGWAPPPFWYPVGISRPMAILFTVLGFLFWWPVGLAILIYMLCTGRIGCRARRAWQMSGDQGQSGWQSGPGGWAPFWKNWCGPSTQPSSGNHAFDEYRAETLRRLEEEQKEFAAFLDRLRFAKDKAEFDQFMAERRQRPPAPPQDQPPQA
jgi:Protein of unknown function (DUF2852)